MEKKMKKKKQFYSSFYLKIPFLLLYALILLLFKSTSGHAAGLLIADGGLGGRLEMTEHDVQVTINNGIAVTHVTQVFRNLKKRQVEALYTFPVPKKASVSNFSMWINGKEMVGEVVEKKRAREIYNSYKRRRRDPGLLEQIDYKTFEMRIFPIGPEASQKVQISYYQELDFDHDRATYVYPLATNGKNGIDSRVTGRFSANVHVKSMVPIISMDSPSHSQDFLMVDHSENYYQASLEQRNGDLASDLVVSYQASRPVTGIDLLASNEPGEDGYFMMTLTAGEELKKEGNDADYVFILDISGSMADNGKLTTSTDSMIEFIKGLGQQDRFDVITFNMRANTLFGKLCDADETSFKRAADFLNSQEAKGGTRLQPAITTAYQYKTSDRPLNVVILSDGMTEQKDRRELMSLITKRPGSTRVFCIGVGNEINRSLLNQMAEEAGGLAAFLSRGDDLKRQAAAFRRKLIHPVASNLHIEISDIDTYDLEPQKLPNLYHGTPIRLFGRYKGKGNSTLHLSAMVNGRQISTKAPLKFTDQESSNPEIERMWAYHRLDRLNAQQESSGDQSLIDEIVRLGEGYSIASEFTSFLVLENDTEYDRWKIKRRNALRIKRDRRAQQRLRQELDKMRQAGPQPGPVMADTDKKLVKKPPVQPKTAPRIAQRPVQQQARPKPSQRINFPRMGGGGAIGGWTVMPILALLGSIFIRRRR